MKWPGGKRWFVQNYSHLLPGNFNRYFEPFLGSGAVFFHLQPRQAVLSDINQEVIAAYEAIKNNWKSVKRSLQYHQRKHSYDHYYSIRDKRYLKPWQAATRMIYLNRTCFNGIYRVNLEGKFNVPMGSKSKVLLDTDDFQRVSQLLQNSTLRVCDFTETINQAQENDLIFADPPYTVRHNLNGFVKYNETLFSWEDQVRLSETLKNARDRGVRVVLTNANHESIRELYKNDGFQLKVVSRYSSIAAAGDNRKQYEELVILSNPKT